MAPTLPDGVELEILHPAFAPGSLVALKKELDLEAFFSWARAQPVDTASRALVLSDAAGRPFAMTMAHYSPPYRSLTIDHFVIAPDRRGAANALTIGRLFLGIVLELAKALGAKRVAVITRRPQAIRRIAGSARTVESVVSLEM
jgi:hypothetical protein